MGMKSVFIVWYSHSRRAETLAGELDGQVSFQYETRFKSRWLIPLRYWMQGWSTWHFLEQERPDRVIVQAPPIFAPLIVAVWCKLRGRTNPSGQQISYVIDCHTGSFFRAKWRWTLPLLRWLAQGAVVTLVASEAALDILRQWGVRGLFLVDGLPILSLPTGTVGSSGERRVAVVGNLDSVDEPVAEVFAAARMLSDVTFYVTGNSKRVGARLQAEKPENVILTGFLPESDYSGLLQNVDGLVILTKSPNILNCGAYEALATGKPAVISDWPQMRRCFRRGFIYADNTTKGIAAAVEKMLDEQITLTREIVTMRSELVTRRQPEFQKLVAFLQPQVPV